MRWVVWTVAVVSFVASLFLLPSSTAIGGNGSPLCSAHEDKDLTMAQWVQPPDVIHAKVWYFWPDYEHPPANWASDTWHGVLVLTTLCSIIGEVVRCVNQYLDTGEGCDFNYP